MGLVIFIKLVTSTVIVLSLIYFNWWLQAVYPSLKHTDGSDPMGPWFWSFEMNVTNVTITTNGTYSPSPFEQELHGNRSDKQVVVVTFAHPTEFSMLRKFVGAIHYWDPGRRIAVWTSGFTGDQLQEARLMLWTDIHLMRGHMQHAKDDSEDRDRDLLGTRKPDQDNAPWRTELALAASKYYPDFIIVPLRFKLIRRLCSLDERAKSSKLFGMHKCEFDTPPGMSCVAYSEYFIENERDGNQECRLQLIYNSTKTPEPLPKNGKPWWCIAVATYSRHGSDVADQALVSVMLPSLIPTILDSLPRYNFAVYVGTQVDKVWDDPHNRGRLLRAIHEILDPYGVELRTYRYPLNEALIDIVWKYNNLIMQGHADGCDYTYQFSDDVKFDTPGWAEAFSYVLDSNGGFGTVGPNDTYNPGRMTLGACGRVHLNIHGWFWPPRLKNWWADNFIQEVYGDYSVPLQGVYISNTQKFGRRYGYCMHSRIEREETARALRRAWRWAITNRPDLVPYLEKRTKETTEKLNSRDRLSNTKPDTHRDQCAVSSLIYGNVDELDYSPYEPPYIPPQVWVKHRTTARPP